MPKIVDHDAQREHLLRGSLELFAARGYDGVTIRGLASALGVSTGALYHYFSGKDDIYRQLFAWAARTDVRLATEGLTDDATLDEVLDRLFAFVASQESALQKMVFLALDYQRHSARSPVVRAAVGTYRETLAKELRILGTPLEGPAFSLLLGAIVHRALDDADLDAHRLALRHLVS